jgi:hypothetical protein
MARQAYIFIRIFLTWNSTEFIYLITIEALYTKATNDEQGELSQNN